MQEYTMECDYEGYEAMLITTDKKLTTKNYKDIEIICITDITTTDNETIKVINNMINDYNQLNN